MKTKKQKIIFIATLITSAVFVSALVAGCQHSHKKMSPERAKRMASWAVEDVLDEVDATDSQIAAFESASYDVIDDVFAAKKGHKGKHKQLSKELSKETPDQEKILALVDEHIEEIRDVAHNSVETMLKAWNTLTIEQKQQLIKELEARHNEMKQ